MKLINPWRRQRKIARLPGSEATPQTTLAQTLEKANAGHIKSVVCLIEWNNGFCCADWSSIDDKTLAYLALMFNKEVQDRTSQSGEVLP